MGTVALEPLKESTFYYPKKDSDGAEFRDVFVLSKTDEDVFAISLHDVEENVKQELLDTAERLNNIIAKLSATKYRRFKRSKIYDGTGECTGPK